MLWAVTETHCDAFDRKNVKRQSKMQQLELPYLTFKKKTKKNLIVQSAMCNMRTRNARAFM